MPAFGSKAHRRQAKSVQNRQKRSDGIDLGHLPCVLHGQVRAGFTDVRPVQFYGVLLSEGPHVWDLMLCSYHLESLSNSTFDFGLCK